MAWEESKFNRLERRLSAEKEKTKVTFMKGAILVCFLIVLAMFAVQSFSPARELVFNPVTHEHFKELKAQFVYAAGNTKVVKKSLIQPEHYEKEVRQLLSTKVPVAQLSSGQIAPSDVQPGSSLAQGNFVLPALEPDTTLEELAPGQYELTTMKNIPTPVKVQDGFQSIRIEANQTVLFPIANQEYTLSLPIKEVGAELPKVSVFVSPFPKALPEDFLVPASHMLSIQYVNGIESIDFTIRLSRPTLPGEQVLLEATWKERIPQQ